MVSTKAATTGQQHQRQCLVRQLLRWYMERGADWLHAYVQRMPAWRHISTDFWLQQRLGNEGAWDDWRQP